MAILLFYSNILERKKCKKNTNNMQKAINQQIYALFK